MKVGYFPGCSLAGTGKEFDKSLRAVLKSIGAEFKEIDDWSCCGASSAHAASHLLSVALPGRNLALAEEQGFESIMAPCAACYNRLIVAQNEIKEKPVIKDKVETITQHKFEKSLDIVNIIQYLQELGIDKIKAKITKDLSDLKVACYYGCLLVRPNAITEFDDAEQPTSMEKIVNALGAQTVDWNYKVECCGASHSIVHSDIVESLTKKILDDAKRHGADLVLVACPMCHSNLDMRQLNIAKHNSEFEKIPALYLTELIGLALGLNEETLGLNIHFIDPMPTLNKKIKEAAIQ